jgi:hypothetical protein
VFTDAEGGGSQGRAFSQPDQPVDEDAVPDSGTDDPHQIDLQA